MSSTTRVADTKASDLVAVTQREHRKNGKLVSESDVGSNGDFLREK
jgi:hypothetical protein